MLSYSVPFGARIFIGLHMTAYQKERSDRFIFFPSFVRLSVLLRTVYLRMNQNRSTSLLDPDNCTGTAVVLLLLRFKFRQPVAKIIRLPGFKD
jgi:hypothetical protein